MDRLALSSLLFAPGNRLDRVTKALASEADLTCIDLEDAVPADEKDATRAHVIDYLAAHPIGAPRTVVRINGLRTREGLADLLALEAATVRPAWVMVPKLASPAEAEIVSARLGAGVSGVIGLIETIAGLTACREIAATPGIAGLMIGIADLSAELGCAIAWEPLLLARAQLVSACAAAGVAPIDGPSLDLSAGSECADECNRAQTLGFTAKAAIHPAQLGPIHAAFRPGTDEIANAQAALDAFAAAGGRAIRFDGRLLEAPLVRNLQRIAAFAAKETPHA